VREGATRSVSLPCADSRDSALDVTSDERRRNAKHTIAWALERRITARVSASVLAVIRAIDLNHETLRGSEKIRNEEPEQWYLPTKDDAQATPANVSP
jgi:hypothetical protein